MAPHEQQHPLPARGAAPCTLPAPTVSPTPLAMSLPQAPRSCRVLFFLSILTQSCSLGTRFSGGWKHQKQQIKLQICSAVLAAASGNMLGCLAGLAEALEAAQPKPNAGSACGAPGRRAGLRAGEREPPGESGAPNPALCGEGLQRGGFEHPLGLTASQVQAEELPVPRGCPCPPVPRVDREGQHGAAWPRLIGRAVPGQAAPLPHGQD